jgi:tetratricopeptide (TPR) repeat protein
MKKYLLWGIIFIGVLSLTCCTLMKAEIKMSQRNYKKAIPLYEEYLAQKPDSPYVKAKLGFAYLKTGQLDKSIAELQQALKIKPGDPYSILYLGMAYLNKEKFDKAIETWQLYRNKDQPLVEEEIRRLSTLVQIAASLRAAKKAIEDEQMLMAIKPDANTIAVCYYQDLSPDKSLRAFQKALTAMVITDLSKIKSLKIVERVRMQALLQEMRLGQTGIVDQNTAPRVGKLLGAENLIVGNLSLGSIQAITSLTSAGTGIVKGTASAAVDQEQFYELPMIIVQDVAKILGITLTTEEKKAVGVPHTTVYKAFVYFGEALDAMDAGNWKKAKDLFDMAVKEDPRFDMAIDGSSSCPDSSSPGIGALSSITASQLSSLAETSVDEAESAQEAADAEAESMSSGGDCFSYDTLVLMADNSLKRIIDLNVNDVVQARDIKTGKLVARKVIDKYRADQDHYYLINGVLKITATHPVFTAGNKWVYVAELRVGDKIASVDGVIEITSLEKVKYDHRVYNFRVEDSHNYFVSAKGKNYYLVHNCK